MSAFLSRGILPAGALKELTKGIYPENSHVVCCPNKHSSFEPFTCLDPTA